MEFVLTKYKNINKLSDIKAPIPGQLFIDILRKQSDMEVMYKDREGAEYAGILKEVGLSSTFFGTIIYFKLTTIVRGKEGYVTSVQSFTVPFKSMIQKIEDIGLAPLSKTDKKMFQKRGEKFIKYTSEPKYCLYKGFATKPGSWFGDIRVNVEGRVMIDINAMRHLNSNVEDDWYEGMPFNNRGTRITDIDSNVLWMCNPYVYGFSFATKDWIKMHIDNVSEITFSNEAFDELIIPENYKDIFVSCLTNKMPSLDSIDGKGSGRVSSRKAFLREAMIKSFAPSLTK
jgi:hypothetical protein